MSPARRHSGVGPARLGDEPNRAGRRLAQLAHIPVSELSGIGSRRASALSAMGIETVLDLLLHFPRRWVDRSHPTPIAELAVGEEAMIDVEVLGARTRPIRGRRPVVEVRVSDGSGELLLVFFNQPYRKEQLRERTGAVVVGKVEAYRGRVQMTNPLVDIIGDQTGGIIPIYPQSETAGVSSRDLARYVAEALQRAGQFAEPLENESLRRLELVGRTEAFLEMHRPSSFPAKERARRRLAFDELFRLQVALVGRKRALAASARAIEHRVSLAAGERDLVTEFVESLAYELTGAQVKALAEIAKDLAAPVPMHRLLQGDVGSGKTIVAAATLLIAVQGGHQGALMVPTEVLAGQHFSVISELVSGLEVPDPSRLGGARPLRVELLTSEVSGSRRAEVLSSLRAGAVDLVVGTHALLTDEVRFSSLGVVVIDEQHRFGVDQRARLREKGQDNERAGDPDLLVMTATPIPRTAAMTVYGDLEYSELDELPPGRSPVRTRWVDDEAAEPRVWARVREEVTAGRQAYVVCARVRASDEGLDVDEDGLVYESDVGSGSSSVSLFAQPPVARRTVRSAIEERDRLASGELQGLAVGLLHGQMARSEKEAVMEAFRTGKIDVLVATTVIEVGVDVPNATVMVICDADRFGIAQLHQLRGRVGRGSARSYCFLLGYSVSDDGARRLHALAATTNGFELAEVDLELRGEGTVLGARQKGRNDLRLASLRRDRELVASARALAEEIVEVDPELDRHPLVREELEVFLGGEEIAYLHRS